MTQQQVGRFEIRDFLGRGAIGDVYLAWDPERRTEVALKLIRTQRADPEMLEAEKNGIALQRQLAEAAPQVAAVYEQGEDAGFYWVAMEYVAGVDLSEILDAGPLSETRAVLIARQLCAMIEVCHQFAAEVGGRRIFGIIHGDIKPENLRLQENDRVRVLDFGIAKHLSQTRRFTVNLFGSLPYTPPERLDRGAVDRQSDLWAVGVVLYLMVSGHPPFSGDDPEELERKIRRGEPPEPLPAEVSGKLRKVIKKSLAFDVARRYAGAAEMKADLDAWLDGLPLPSESAPEAAAPDLNSTRRTDRGTVVPFRREIDATRRTTDPHALPPPLPSPAAFSIEPDEAGEPERIEAAGDDERAEGITAAEAAGTRPRRRRWLPVVFAVLAAAFLINQAWVHGEAREIQHALVATPNPDLDAICERYQKAERYTLGLGLGAAREELRSALVQQADRILDSFHGDAPRTTERGWERAHHNLQEALDLDYDRETRARMIYAQAQLDRIASQTLRAQGNRAEADKKLEDAIAGFRDAARRAPDWPDPYLGLARVYSYETFDLDSLQKALGDLGKRGYSLGRREKAMLADGFRKKGIDLETRAGKTTRADDQVVLWEHARDQYQQALSFYNDIPGYGSSKVNRTDVEQRLRDVEAHLDAIHQPGVLEKLLRLGLRSQ